MKRDDWWGRAKAKERGGRRRWRNRMERGEVERNRDERKEESVRRGQNGAEEEKI